MTRPGVQVPAPDHFQEVYEAVRRMLKAGESEESVEDAFNLAVRDHEDAAAKG